MKIEWANLKKKTPGKGVFMSQKNATVHSKILENIWRMVGGIFYSQLRQLDIQTKVKTAEITCDQHFSSRFQQDQDCRRCLANGLNISGAPDSEVKMKNFFMSCSMVDVSSDGDLNFPRVEKCKWCKSSPLHLGSAGTAGDWGKANTKCGRAPPWIDQPPWALCASLLKMPLTLLHLSHHQAACYSSGKKGKEMCVKYSGQS